MEQAAAITGCILGTAVGDALGLPYEGLSRERGFKILGPPDRYRFFFGQGMVSDDTEQTCMVAQALIASAEQPELFQQELTRRMRTWFLSLPAGIGLATARALLKSLVGFPPGRTGVFSAGNGPAMRSAILGVAAMDVDTMVILVKDSCEITHTDPKAFHGALAVALAARLAKRSEETTAEEYLEKIRELLHEHSAEEFIKLIESVAHSIAKHETTAEFALISGLKKGVSGYVFHTVPVCIHAWLTHQNDFPAAVSSVIHCGGDTDTTAAIVGGITGTHVGKAGIPENWLNHLIERPCTVEWMEQLAHQLAEITANQTAQKPLSVFRGTIVLRNLFFLLVVLTHGFRRLFPPY